MTVSTQLFWHKNSRVKEKSSSQYLLKLFRIHLSILHWLHLWRVILLLHWFIWLVPNDNGPHLSKLCKNGRRAARKSGRTTECAWDLWNCVPGQSWCTHIRLLINPADKRAWFEGNVPKYAVFSWTRQRSYNMEARNAAKRDHSLSRKWQILQDERFHCFSYVFLLTDKPHLRLKYLKKVTSVYML